MFGSVAIFFTKFTTFADENLATYPANFVAIFDLVKKYNYLNVKVHFSKFQSAILTYK